MGSVGDCTLPSDTAGLALNVTAVDATAPTFLTFFPTGVALPTASNLNPTPGQPPAPNAVNVDLSAGGEFSIYNLAGTVHTIVDVVGIYDDHNHNDQYLSAVVAPADPTAAIVRGQGATGVTRQANGSYRVAFDRDVSDCTWVASYGQPDDSFVDAKWATVRGRGVDNEVGVVIRDADGVQIDGNGFQLVVICP